MPGPERTDVHITTKLRELRSKMHLHDLHELALRKAQASRRDHVRLRRFENLAHTHVPEPESNTKLRVSELRSVRLGVRLRTTACVRPNTDKQCGCGPTPTTVRVRPSTDNSAVSWCTQRFVERSGNQVPTNPIHATRALNENTVLLVRAVSSCFFKTKSIGVA